MPKRFTLDFIKDAFKQDGFTLLTKTYYNSRQTLFYTCKNNKVHETTWFNWRRSSLKKCSCEKQHSLAKTQIGRLKVIIEGREGSLITTIPEYKNNKTKISYICKRGHLNTVTPESLFSGHWCKRCADIHRSRCMCGESNPNFKNGAKRLGLAAYDTYNNKLQKIGFTTYKVYVDGVKVIGLYCSYCGKKFIPKRTAVLRALRERSNLFCSNYCSGKFYSKERDFLTGENNPNWKGGKSFESYCPIWSDKTYKEYIRQRDNNICRNPCCYRTTKKLSVHHIDYNKKNCYPYNLITLCVGCNARANKDRDWHKEWYSFLMINRFGIDYDRCI